MNFENINQIYGRSFLFTPANKSELFEKALHSGADIILLDLEDAVSIENKKEARQNIQTLFSNEDDDINRIGIRINALNTSMGLEDLLMLKELPVLPKVIVVPKFESYYTIEMIRSILNHVDSLSIIGLIETAYSVSHLSEILNTPFKPDALMLGAADLCADLDAENDLQTLLSIRSQMVSVCATYGIGLIDTPFFEIHNLNGLKQETQLVKRLGFSAKAAIHPSHISIINETFSPSDNEIARAKEIIKLANKGAGQLNGHMIDYAMAKKAHKIINKADLIK
ncbi:aldolase/citrate lyase family protein [Rhizosphaericola mali]|uniref:CoA ester lyase n=1 Tax=Rhizosphaericola mali TaxID=2545455 RepID=A0A5P2G3K3_9BACT|nr:aldolase/citrate lyase family protein [Rhizosphaericola mali]QES88709.1 CoA ester lyase [Rhizosphaericola mali]